MAALESAVTKCLCFREGKEMNDESSIYDAEPENLDRLVFEILGESGAGEDSASAATVDRVLEQLGDQIGRYKLLSVLGEGGMGIVYLAEQQEPIRRKVAFKVIKPGMDSKRVVARFEAERQALALLDHQNIAHVYDAGTTESGRPYFVMEYVKGLPITEYCDRHKLIIEERLRLFQQVCQAVQHAHQKGIIHRDIKPSNILVSMENDRSNPKIIDFGIAKALAQPITERTLATEESQLLGTPEYMSPEQADMATEDIDTRSDIYSLGILLYVLLTGVLPFDSDTLRTGGIERIRQVIRETDPKTPSTCLKKLGEEALPIAQNRQMEVQTLTKHLKKELEWIPLKAMRKERSERYRSASELADDIQNYLKGAPLIAGPESAAYLLKKFVRRKRTLVTGVAAVLIVLIAGVAGIMKFAVKAERRRVETQAVADFLTDDVLGAVEQIKGRKASVIDVLDLASAKLDEGMFENQASIEVSIRSKIAFVYWVLGYMEKTVPHRKWIYQELLSEQGKGKHSIVPSLSGAAFMLAWSYYKAGEYQKAESLYNEQIRVSESTKDDRHVFRIRLYLAEVYKDQGRYAESKRLYLEMMETPYWKDLIAEKEGTWEMGCLAETYQALGQYEEAEKILERVINLSLEWNRQPSPKLKSKLPVLYVAQERYQEAEVHFRKIIDLAKRELPGEGHLHTLFAMNGLAVLQTKVRQYDEAESLFQEVLERRKEKLGIEHPKTLETLNDFGILRLEQQRYAEAESLLREALIGRQRKLGDDHPACSESKHELGLLYKVQGDYDKAETLLLDALEGRRLKLGDTHPHTIESWNKLIDLYEAWNKPEKAKEWRAKLVQIEDFEK